MIFCQLKHPKCLPSKKIQCFWQHLQASLFFPIQKHFLCQTVIWNNVLTQKIHVQYVLHLYTVKRPVCKQFWGPTGWHWITRAVTFLSDWKWRHWKMAKAIAKHWISRTMTRTASLQQLQGHGQWSSRAGYPVGKAVTKSQALTARRGRGQQQGRGHGQWYLGYVTGIPAQGISKMKMLKDCGQDSNSDDVIETSKF